MMDHCGKFCLPPTPIYYVSNVLEYRLKVFGIPLGLSSVTNVRETRATHK